MADVVVIDDRITNRNILTRLALSVAEGLKVTSFARPGEALARFRQHGPPDLVITDFNMPDMDGAEFIQAMRLIDGFAEVPIIVVTVYEDRDFRYRALEAGATDFLLSPVDHLEFRSRARNLLTMRKQQRLLAERAVDLERTLHEKLATLAVTVSKEPVEAVLDLLPLAVSLVDREGRILFVNRAHEQTFDHLRDNCVEQSREAVFGENYAARHRLLDDKTIETGQPIMLPKLEKVAVGGVSHSVLTVKAPLSDAAGQVDRIVSLSLDITGLLLPMERPPGVSHVDELTGLADADLFRDRLEQELVRARRQNALVGVMILDLDRFKGVNDAFGKEFGDAMLAAVAMRMRSRLRETDTLARLQSDEFVVLQTGLKRPDDAAELARRLAEAFSEPFMIEGREVHCSISAGITLFPADGRSVEQLLKNAELAMYRAKASGRDGYRFFAAEMNLAARRAVTLERELRQALAGEQFTVHYQPQVELMTGRVLGMEALVRWNHPQRGLLRPGEFIRVTEDIGLIAPLTAWILQHTCSQHRRWQDMGLTDLRLSVNLSPIQFRERGVELMVERVLRESGLSPTSLDVELTENAVIENSATALASLRHLHQLGVTLSLDDFGTGYSSLSYVKRLPVQRLKIDQSFIQNLQHGGNDEVIVRAIVNLGRSLGLRVIAEGVETDEQLARLRKMGCEEVQGDFISPPLPAAEFEAWVLRGQHQSAALP